MTAPHRAQSPMAPTPSSCDGICTVRGTCAAFSCTLLTANSVHSQPSTVLHVLTAAPHHANSYVSLASRSCDDLWPACGICANFSYELLTADSVHSRPSIVLHVSTAAPHRDEWSVSLAPRSSDGLWTARGICDGFPHLLLAANSLNFRPSSVLHGSMAAPHRAQSSVAPTPSSCDGLCTVRGICIDFSCTLLTANSMHSQTPAVLHVLKAVPHCDESLTANSVHSRPSIALHVSTATPYRHE
jgi:hypothetical protein